MAEVTETTGDLPVEYVNEMNRRLTRFGFGPQTQGVHIDWPGLDTAMREHYAKELRAIVEDEVRAELEKEFKQGLADKARTRKKRAGNKGAATGGEDGDAA